MKSFLEKYVEENKVFLTVIEEFDEFFRQNKTSKFQKILNEFDFELTGKNFGKFVLDKTFTVNEEIYVSFGAKENQFSYSIEPSFFFERGYERELTPSFAKLKDLDYSFKLFLNLSVEKESEKLASGKILLCEFPLIIGSSLFQKQELNLKKEIGGYFILKGIERTFISSESLSPNIIYGEIEKTTGSKINSYLLKILCANNSLNILCVLRYNLLKDEFFFEVNDRFFKSIDPLVLLQALGFEDFELLKTLLQDPEIDPIYTKILFENYFEKIKKGKNEYLSEISGLEGASLNFSFLNYLKTKVFIHSGLEENTFINKAFLLVDFIKKLLICISKKKILEFNKDNLKNKSILTVTSLFEVLFAVALRTFFKNIKLFFEKTYLKKGKIKVPKVLENMSFQNLVNFSFATGNWVKKISGICQLSETTNIFSSISQFKRIVSTLDSTQKYAEARTLNPTQFGRQCSLETPDGKSIGLTKTYALFSKVAASNTNISIKELKKELNQFTFLAEPSFLLGEKYFSLFLNNSFVGFLEKKEKKSIIKFIKEKRTKRDSFFRDFSISGTKTKLHLFSINGRLLRAVYVVENGKLKITEELYLKFTSGKISFNFLLEKGYLEYLDTFEEETSKIAYFYYKDVGVFCSSCFSVPPKKVFTFEHFLRTKGKNTFKCFCGTILNLEPILDSSYTHMEISPLSLFGFLAGVIPYIEYSASPRTLLGTGMIRQALSSNFENVSYRNESRSFILLNPQTPIVNTYINTALGNFSYGINAVTMLQNFEEYNSFDALVINRASLERGFGRTVLLKQYSSSISKSSSIIESFGVPGEGISSKLNKEYFSLLEEDGFLKVNEKVNKESVIIGKIQEELPLSSESTSLLSKKRDISIKSKISIVGSVDSICVLENGLGEITIKMKLRYFMAPKVGDKFSSRHGQKGVLGKIVCEKDLPFTAEGISPEIVANPHGLPSRMNYAYLLELLAGKIGAELGEIINGTSFDNFSKMECLKYLQTKGITDKQEVYSGKAKRKKKQLVNVGIIYYMRLHHFSSEKYFYRSTGPVQILTRQPTEGKNRLGGLRFGEMERDALLGYGASYTLKERLLYSSDVTTIFVCKTCKSYLPTTKKWRKCVFCNDFESIRPVSTAYAFKLMLNEIQSMGINPKLVLE